MLLMADFRVGVDVAADGDQLTDHGIRLPRDRGSTGRSWDGSLHRLSVTCGHRTSRRRPSGNLRLMVPPGTSSDRDFTWVGKSRGSIVAWKRHSASCSWLPS